MKKTSCHTSSRSPIGGGVFFALFAVVAIALLAVSCIRPEEDEGGPAKEAVRLSSLTVQHTDSGTQTVTDLIEADRFDPSKRNYEISLDDYSIQDGVITIAGEAAEEGVDLVFDPESVTLPIYNAETVAVYHADDMETPAYTVVIMPSQSAEITNYDLLHLSLHFNVDGANLIQGFSGSSQSYSVNLEKGAPSSIFVEARAASSAAQVKISDGGTVLAPYTSGGNNAVIAVPTSGDKVITVSVQRQKDAAFKDYTVTLNAYAASLTTYAGTITGVNAPYKITGLIAREAGSTSGQSARLGSTPSQWTLTVNSDWTPHSFIVELQDANHISYKSAVVTPTIGNPSAITVAVAGVGKVIASAEDMQSVKNAPGIDYALGQDLDLGNIIWGVGDYAISDFSGNFYGNGYTIDNLQFNAGTSSIGLFNTLGDNAHIENFTLHASTKNTPPLSDFCFGAVAGTNNGANVKISGVKAVVDFVFGSFGGDWAHIGGLIGTTGKGVTIERCVSIFNVKITHSSTSGVTDNSHTFGGFIGHGGSNDSSKEFFIKDSYTVCNIDVLCNANTNIGVGGLVGQGNGTAAWNIENFYATGTIKVSGSGGPYGNRFVGGFAGGHKTYTQYVNIKNSAAITETVLNLQSGTPSESAYGRLVGKVSSGTFNNNYALGTMVVGTTESGTTVTGTSTNKNGLNKSAADFKNPATWQALNFDPTVWDYSTVARDGRPVLR